MNIKITDVFVATEKQKASGILGTVNLGIHSEDGTIVARLNGITVRNGEKGQFLAMPSWKQGEGAEAKYRNHFQVFPFEHENEEFNNKQKTRMDLLLKEVNRIISNGGTSKPKLPANSAPKVTQSAPVAPKAAPAKANEDPWNV